MSACEKNDYREMEIWFKQKRLGPEWAIDEFWKKKSNPKNRKSTSSLHFLFRCVQNHYSKLTSEMMKLCEQILKEDSAQFNSISFNCKNSLNYEWKMTSGTQFSWNCMNENEIWSGCDGITP